MPFDWRLTHAADSWTDNSDQIAALSDPPIIEGLLRERELGSIVGAAKTQKTWFGLGLGLHVAEGREFLGREVHQRKVLYLDYELKAGTFRKRMCLLADKKPEGFYYQTLRGCRSLPTVDDIAALVEAEGYGLVIVDSLYRTGWMTEENNNDSTPRDLAPLQDFTRRVPCSLIVIDHTAKGGGNERSAVDAARGASAKGGFWDCLLVLRPTDKGPDPEGNYTILDPVLRDWPRIDKLPLLSFNWDASGCAIEAAGDIERGQDNNTPSKILEVVANAGKPVGAKDIWNECGLKEATARRCLDTLEAKGRLLVLPDPNHRQRKLYRIPDMMDEPLQPPPNPTT